MAGLNSHKFFADEDPAADAKSFSAPPRPVAANSSPAPRMSTGRLRPVGAGSAPVPENSLNARTSYIQRSALFAHLSFAECIELASAAREWRVVPRQTIFQEGDPVRSVCLLASGRVKITQLSRSGAEVIVRVQGVGEMVGAIGLLPGSKHLLTAQALEACELLTWNVRTFEAFEDRFPRLRRNALHIVAERLQLLEERFLELATEQVAARLARMLIRLLEQANHSSSHSGYIQLSQEELAQMIGTTLFTVSRLLCDWEQRGIIQTQRKAVLVKDPRGLLELAENGDGPA